MLFQLSVKLTVIILTHLVISKKGRVFCDFLFASLLDAMSLLRERERQRETERDTHTQRKRERDRDRDRDRAKRERERQRERERERIRS